jgi:hypothetical protein
MRLAPTIEIEQYRITDNVLIVTAYDPSDLACGATLLIIAKRPSQDPTASHLTVRERVLLFCVASGTDWQRAGIAGEVVTWMTRDVLSLTPAIFAASWMTKATGSTLLH